MKVGAVPVGDGSNDAIEAFVVRQIPLRPRPPKSCAAINKLSELPGSKTMSVMPCVPLNELMLTLENVGDAT